MIVFCSALNTQIRLLQKNKDMSDFTATGSCATLKMRCS